MARKETIPSEPSQAAQTTTGRRERASVRARLDSCVLEELWSIWHADPRVPSIKSRRSWAISRNANPRLVDGWFLRRRTCAKKAGQPISDDSYELPLDPPTAPKQEDTEPDLVAIPSPPSDDTLVSFPDVQDDMHNLEDSSDTVFDEDMLTEPKRPETTAYKEVPLYLRHERDHPEPNSSLPDLYAARDRQDEDVVLLNRLVCSQFHFTCMLCCSSTPQDLIPPGFSATFVPSSRFGFSPELSAIPFLFRTPAAVFPANATSRRTVDDCKSIEDELERLVNDGELDFSFLEDPQLACMELVD